ncbi:cellulase family glycosylhydrolase [Tenacibaculum sp. M341]|uniref:cellulase family glycosylhydrolase n=1 Tax=Tenacibaculum sp. M341 TaxID=2530339 RepID=UPI00104BA9DD|nr:cellulase family glycosylhydrolase [Tenacibaculum sp. M341]TCI90710.1 T9SS type A sorting domain-containing protein [Tenacibaculum sp. M341]
MKNLKKSLTFLTIFAFVLCINSQNNCDSRPVDTYGSLKVSGNKIVNQKDEPVSFAGNSFFWSNTGWGAEKFYNKDVVSWLKKDWNSNIVRAAMGVEDNGGYLNDPVGNKNRVKTIVEAAINEGLYVIIDWHSHHAEEHEEEAVAFFKEMASLYGKHPNVIYEIYNEPIYTPWSTIKSYAEKVISAIRSIDQNNLIIVGTSTWSQDVDAASRNPITSSKNIAYTLHFYAATHKESLRQKARTALNNGIALMVTEWGSVSANGNGAVDNGSTDEWMKFLAENKISHLNWSVHDKNEGASIIKSGASTKGNWSSQNLTDSGKKVRTIMKNWCSNNDETPGDGEPDNGEPDNGGDTNDGDETNGNIIIRAKGVSGDETIDVSINNKVLRTITLSRNFKNYAINGDKNKNVKVEFTNDVAGVRRDVQVDYITISGKKLQAEDQKVNTGVWQNDSCGGSYSDWIHCPGYILFENKKDDNNDGGGDGDQNNQGCGNIPVWSSSTIYPQSNTKVVYENKIYKNNWYTRGQNPKLNSDKYQVWTLIGNCNSAANKVSKGKISSDLESNKVKITQKTDNLTISVDNLVDYSTITIHNINGQIILSKKLMSTNTDIPLKKFKNDLYFINVFGKKKFTKKIIKK